MQPNEASSDFPKLLLELGDRKVPFVHNEIQIPRGLGKLVGNMNDILSSVYPDLKQLQEMSSDWFCERSILSPKNDMVSIINEKLLSSCEGESVT